MIEPTQQTDVVSIRLVVAFKMTNDQSVSVCVSSTLNTSSMIYDLSCQRGRSLILRILLAAGRSRQRFIVDRGASLYCTIVDDRSMNRQYHY